VLIQFRIDRRAGACCKEQIMPNMADMPVPGFQAFWTDQWKMLQSEYQLLKSQYPDADA
jgi:hypothetical protein